MKRLLVLVLIALFLPISIASPKHTSNTHFHHIKNKHLFSFLKKNGSKPPLYTPYTKLNDSKLNTQPELNKDNQGAPATEEAKPNLDTNVQNDTTPEELRPSSTGPQLITLNFSSIPTRELLQLFAQFTHLNFIISENIKGTMSIHLKNIPWPEALEAIITSQGLAKRHISQAIIIAPASEIEAQLAKEIESKQKIASLRMKTQIKAMENKNKLANLQPLNNKVIRLSYAKAADIVKLLTETGNLLSSRGAIGVDDRANAVWVRDTPKHLSTVFRLVKQLDFPVKQVMIKASIVSIERPFERSLGIRWGISNPTQKLSGTLEGANAALTEPLTSVPIPQRLNFNLPANNLENGNIGPPATAGLALGRIGDTFVDLELSALERVGKIQIISSPKLVTSNMKAAYIKVGTEIPYQEATSSGATSLVYRDAVLGLTVTPRITPNHKVILQIKISNDRPGSAPINTALGGQAFPIDTEEEESEVLVDNKQTIVLGGIYKKTKSHVSNRIPFLSQIPLIGRLFQQNDTNLSTEELLIFLTPHIIDKPSDLNNHTMDHEYEQLRHKTRHITHNITPDHDLFNLRLPEDYASSH